MIYRKNVGKVEALLRSSAGAGLIGAGLLGPGFSPWGLVLISLGVTAIVTGLLGYCPACAMVGRRPLP